MRLTFRCGTLAFLATLSAVAQEAQVTSFMPFQGYRDVAAAYVLEWSQSQRAEFEGILFSREPTGVEDLWKQSLALYDMHLPELAAERLLLAAAIAEDEPALIWTLQAAARMSRVALRTGLDVMTEILATACQRSANGGAIDAVLAEFALLRTYGHCQGGPDTDCTQIPGRALVEPVIQALPPRLASRAMQRPLTGILLELDDREPPLRYFDTPDPEILQDNLMALKAILEQASEDKSDFENAIYYGVVARMVLAGILLAEDARVELTSALVAQGDRYTPFAGSEDLSVLSAREYMAVQGEALPELDALVPKSFFAGEEQVERIPGQFFKILDMNNPSSFDEQVATMTEIVQSARYSPLASSLRGYVDMFAAHHERLLKQKLSGDRNARLPELNAKIRALRDQGLTPESLEALRPAAREHFGDMKPEAHAALLERARLVALMAKQTLHPELEECLSEGPLLDRRYPIPRNNLEVWSGWRGNLDAQNRWEQGAELIATIPVPLDAIPKNSPDDQALAFIDEALRSKMIEVMGNPWAAPELLELLLKRVLPGFRCESSLAIL